MENLKNLMGSAYKEGITVEEINTFLGTGKFVNIKEGKYVDKDKYENAVKEKENALRERDSAKADLASVSEKYKDYETLKSENEKFKGEKADADLKAKLKGYGISEKSFKYVKGDIADKTLVLGDDDNANKDAVKKYLEANPEFALKEEKTPGGNVVISTKIDQQKSGGGIKEVKAQPWNQNRSI